MHFADHTPGGTFFLSPSPEGWKILDVTKGEKSGFMAVLYESTFEDIPRQVLAFRGTDADPRFMNELEKDAITDGLQGTGGYTEAYEQTRLLTRKIQKLYPNVVFAGHSLGGSEASLAGLLTGNPTYTFNSAGLHVNSIARANISPQQFTQNEHQIQAFFADNDPLNFYQDRAVQTKMALKALTDLPKLVPGIRLLPNPLDPILTDPHSLPQAVGVRHLIPSGSTDWYKGADAGGHSVQPMVNVIEQQKTEDTATLQQFTRSPAPQP